MSILVEEAVSAYLDLACWERLTEASEKERVGELLKKGLAGDSTALGDIYQMYYRQLVSVARARGGLSPDQAEDAVQTVMTKILTDPQKYMGKFVNKPGELIRYLKGLVFNQALDIQRKRKVRRSGGDAAFVAAPEPTQRLGSEGIKALNKAVQSTLKKQKGNAQKFIRQLMFDPQGNLKGDKKGELGPLAVQFAPSKDPKKAANWGSQIKRRFLQDLCTNKDLCDLLAALPGGKSKAAKYICKGVKGSCAEALERLAGLHDLVEGSESWLTEEAAMDIVLSWLRGVVAEE